LEKPILRVLIVEDHEPMRKYIATKLRGKLQLRIVAEVAGGVDAVQKTEELRPDLIVMDVGLPRLDGIETTRRIQKVHPKSKSPKKRCEAEDLGTFSNPMLRRTYYQW
jgi:CheY-like chemotaxis protein